MAFGDFRSSILVVYIIVTARSDFMLCEARRLFGMSPLQGCGIPDDSAAQPTTKLLGISSRESDIGAPCSSPNFHPLRRVSHFSLAPLDSIAPIPSPHDRIPPTHPYGLPTPPPPTVPAVTPSPPKNNPAPSPPGYGYSPPKFTPGPPLNPPSAVHPPPQPKAQVYAVWCVAKPTVPDSIIQLAMDYACGSGANCKPIQPNGPCYQPNTPLAHASFAFNSYWQKKKEAGGTCDFGGAAMLVTVDPSFNGCRFDFS